MAKQHIFSEKSNKKFGGVDKKYYLCRLFYLERPDYFGGGDF